MTEFSYDAAFERNLGWLTEGEQLALRGKRVAIAGMGGVGGVHLLTLTRLGIGAFHIADFDRFSLVNFNRQIGANVTTIDRPKVEVLEEMALAVNPELEITRFDQGVTADNVESFLAGVDLFVDGFDFFVMDMRRRVYARCHELGIPAVCAGPIGMGTGFLAFVPPGMSFEQYFHMEGQPELEQYLRFLIGLVPRMLHRRYLVDPSRLNLAMKTGPSTGAACELCAGVAAVSAVKILLRRGDVQPAPWSHHYDPFRGILATTRLRRGLDGPLQRLKLRLARAGIARMLAHPVAVPPTFTPEDPIDEILHAARWTPSGDNEQPWRFEKLGNDAVLLHMLPHDGRNVYQYRAGEPNVLAIGMLLESLRIGASAHARRMEWRVDAAPDPLRLHIRFTHDATIMRDRLYPSLGLRAVDRNRYRTRQLTAAERSALEVALTPTLRVDWHAGFAQRWRFARVSALATSIRLRSPETLAVHQEVIDWDTPLSPTKIPAGALGLHRPTLWIMRWAMRNWQRTQMLNRIGAPLSAAVEMDYLPILCSAAAFTLRFAAPGQTRDTEELLEAGSRIQRFWLTAAHLGLAMQPAMSVLIFADYGQKATQFTTEPRVLDSAQRLSAAFRRLFGAGTEDFVFMGRIGEPLRRSGICRSVRRPLADLMTPPADSPTE